MCALLFSSGFYCYFVLLSSETFWSQLPQISTDLWKMWTRKHIERQGKFLCFSQCFLSSGVPWNPPEFQHCVGCGEGELQENFGKDALFYVGTQKLQKIINTALLSQLLLSRIVSSADHRSEQSKGSQIAVSFCRASVVVQTLVVPLFSRSRNIWRKSVLTQKSNALFTLLDARLRYDSCLWSRKKYCSYC